VARDVSRGAGLVGIGGGVLLARNRMLEVHGANGTTPASWAIRNSPNSQRPNQCLVRPETMQIPPARRHISWKATDGGAKDTACADSPRNAAGPFEPQSIRNARITSPRVRGEGARGRSPD
jgi:hypothetical protein